MSLIEIHWCQKSKIKMHSMFFNPIIEIEGQRKGFHMAISVNLKLFKRQKRNKINKKYNKYTYKENLLDIILNKFYKITNIIKIN